MQKNKQPKTKASAASRKAKDAPKHSAQVQPEMAQVIRTDQDAGAPPALHEPRGLRSPLDSQQAAPARAAKPSAKPCGPSGSQAVRPSSSDSTRPMQRRRYAQAGHSEGARAQEAQTPASAGQQASQQQGGSLAQSPAASSSSSEPLQHVFRHRQGLPQASQPQAAMPSVSSPGHADRVEPCSGPPLIHETPTPAISPPGAGDKPGARTDINNGSSALRAEPSRAQQNQRPSALIQEEVLVPKQMIDADKDPAQAPRRRQPRELQGLMPFAWDK